VCARRSFNLSTLAGLRGLLLVLPLWARLALAACALMLLLCLRHLALRLGALAAVAASR
jgi:hypothetical protein